MLKKTYDVLEKESLIKAKSFKELKNDFNVLMKFHITSHTLFNYQITKLSWI